MNEFVSVTGDSSTDWPTSEGPEPKKKPKMKAELVPSKNLSPTCGQPRAQTAAAPALSTGNADSTLEISTWLIGAYDSPSNCMGIGELATNLKRF